MVDKTRVLLVGRGLGLGGMERLLVAQTQFGDTDRYDYAVAYSVPWKDDLVPEFAALGVRSISLADSGSWVKGLAQLVRSREFDVIHSHSPLIAGVVRLSARSMRDGPRLVYTEHNSWGPYGRATRMLNRATYRLDDAQIAVSSAAYESVPSQLRARLSVLAHGIDLEEVGSHGSDRARVRAELGIDPGAVVIGVVANHRPEKNYEGLVSIARRICAADPAVQFVSVGQGPLLEQTRSAVLGAGLEDRFQVLGHRDDATSVMSTFDVFTLASRWEGLPVALMEARALGLPVVVTAVGGMVDHVEHGVDGFLVAPGDESEHVAALEQLVSDSERRRSMAAASKVAAETFDARRSVAEIERRYAEAESR